MYLKLQLSILALFLCALRIESQSQTESQQSQVPVRRINIPVHLKGSSRGGGEVEGKSDHGTIEQHSRGAKCPQCLEKRLILHYMSLGCTPVIKGGCHCPSRYECPSDTRSGRLNLSPRDYDLIDQNRPCTYKGRLYEFGKKIVTDEKCLDCYCGSTWKNHTLDHSACSPVQCRSASDQTTRGCTPVYSDSSCCPVQHICPKINTSKIRGLQSGSYMCEFEGRKYPIGSHLYTEHRCVDCVCRVPPQFTCQRKNPC